MTFLFPEPRCFALLVWSHPLWFKSLPFTLRHASLVFFQAQSNYRLHLPAYQLCEYRPFYIRSLELSVSQWFFRMKTYYCCLLLSERYIFFLHLSCGCLIHLHSWLQHALCVWGTLSSNPICQPLFRLSGITTGEENSSVSALCVCVCRVYSYCLTAPLPHWCETIYCLFLWLAGAQKPLSALASIFWISSSGVSTSSEDKHYGWFLCLFFFLL